MLTIEILKQNTALTGLTDEQRSAIASASANDEDQVIGRKLKEVHDQYDADIKNITGKEKPGGVKTYDHLKTVLTDLTNASASAGDVGKLQQQITDLEAEKTKLTNQLTDGSGDTTLKTRIQDLEKQVRDKTSEVDQVKTQLSSEVETLKTQLTEKDAAIMSTTVNGNIDGYIVKKGIKFDDTLPETVLNEILKNRRQTFISTIKTDVVDDGNGGKRTVVRDQSGEIMRNPENGLEPFSPGELFVKNHLSDLVAKGKQQTGAGTQSSGQTTSTVLDLTGARTQIAADEVIVNHIMKNEGIARTDPKFAERQTEIRTEHKVADLPVRDEG